MLSPVATRTTTARCRRLLLVLLASCVATALACAASGGIAAAAVLPPPGCVPAQSVSVIVDDSDSMAESDPLGLRRRATELLLTKPTGQQRTVGAVEFGGEAGPLFAPGVVGADRAAMLASLSALDDDGYDGDSSTDYNAAFSAASEQQPGADARIFLTDGAHNGGTYLDGHAGGPRTYVVGLGIGPVGRGTEEARLLGRIASETGGAYFPLDRTGHDRPSLQASRLQSVFNEIDALLNCATVATHRTVRLTKPGRNSRELTFSFGGHPALEIVTTWVSDRSRIEVSTLVVCDRNGRIVGDLRGRRGGRGRARRVKLRVRTVRGGTFVTVVVARPPRGVKVRIRVKGRRLPRRETPTLQARPLDAFPVPVPVPDPVTLPVPPQPVPTTPADPPVLVRPPDPPRPPARVNAYDNYGPANAGRAMCRGNPGRPESMPGGTAAQTFTVPTGVASLDRALVQIDPDNRVNAHAVLSVNGQDRASADAAASGDTTFGFASVPVRAGDAVQLRVSFTASFGKIITVYTTGAPGGTFTASNSCPDGAPNVTTSATGLRAVISGLDR